MGQPHDSTEAGTGTILIVEDEAELRFILRAHLRAAGFEVLEAVDGAAAVRLAGERVPDVVIMDIGMPVMDGIAATRALKADPRTAHVPIIMLTARTGPDDIIRGLEAGAQEYLPKPFDVAELLARVRTVYRLAVARKDLDRLNTRLEAEVDVKTRRLQHLYEFMRDLNHADSRDRILDLLIRCVEQTTGAKRISLFLRDVTGRHLVCQRAVGMDPAVVEKIPVSQFSGVTGQVVRSGKTLAAKTYGDGRGDRGYRRDDFVSTPLAVRSLEGTETVIGVLNATEKNQEGPFVKEEIECIRSICDTTTIALENLDRRTRLQQSVGILLQTLGNLAEYRDEETTLHLERVSRMARLLAEELRRSGPYAWLVTREYLEMLVQAAPMHDIGKVGIPDEILTKPGALTAEEFQIMKTHTDIGRRVLMRAVDPSSPNPLLQMCIDIVHGHHERFDGTGYPRRVKGSDIPLAARIIAVVDAYDAITSRRRYKKAKSHEEAVKIIRCEAAKHFDPVLVEAFLRCHEQFNTIREGYEDPSETIEPARA